MVENLIAVMVSLLTIGISIGSIRWLLLQSESHRHTLGRWAVRARIFLNLNPLQFVRVMIPGYVFLGLVGFAILMIYGLLATDTGALRDLAIGAPLLIAGGALQILITLRTGRPRVLVLPPCRDMSRQEVERWLGLA